MLTNTERQQIVEEVNAGTYGIDEALDDIAAAQKGEEVRKALYAEALVLNREGHAGSTDMIARQQVANLQTSVNGQISTLRTEVGEDIDNLETALNSGLATQNGRIAAQNATIANVVANYNVEYGSTELWASTGETGALAAGTTVTLSEDVSHFDYIDIYSFCGNSNVLDTVPVDAKLQSSQGYALRWVNLSDPDSGSYKAYVRIIETRLHIIGTTLTIDHQVTYRNGEEVDISGAEITQSNRSTYMGELGIMKIVGRKITANTEIEDVRIGADGTEYASAGQAVRAQVTTLESAIPVVDSTLSTQGAAADAKVAGDKVAELKSAIESAISMYTLSWGPGGLYSATGIEYASTNVSRTPFIPIQPGTTFYYESQDTSLPFTIYEFATNETTTASVNNRLVISDQSYRKRQFYKVGEGTNFIRLQSGVSVDVIRGKIDAFNLASPYANVIARFCPPYVTPEMFSAQSTTDVQMIQSAVNYAFENKCDIMFPRMYTLNSNEYVYVNKYSGVPDTSSRFVTRFIGINGGGITKRATGHIFTGYSAYAYSGDFQFINLNFESDSGAGCNVFNLNVMMRMLVENCFFKNVDSVARNDYVQNDVRTYYCQDITYRNCTIIGGTGYAFYARGCYAVTFDGLTIEHRDGGIRLGVNTNDNYYMRCRNLVIQNCVIEGISGENIRTVDGGTPTNGWAINIQNPIQVLIQGCYFERNYGNILLRNDSTGSFYSADVRDCLLSGTFAIERYGNATEYQDIMDNPYLVTLGGNVGDYQIEKCVSQFGGILNVGTNISGVILYLANNYNSDSTGARTYSSYTYDALSGTWKGNNEQVDSTTITGKNNGISQCKTYQIVSLT